MIDKRLISILFLVFFTIGCQQTQLNSAKPLGSGTNSQTAHENLPSDGSYSTFINPEKPNQKIQGQHGALGKKEPSNPMAQDDKIEEPSVQTNLSFTQNSIEPGKKNANGQNQNKTEQSKTDSWKTDQEKIDQALELCNYAQEMWEEGNLDEALNNLDSAYYLILEVNHSSSPELNQQKEDIRYLISKRILEIYASRQIVVTGKYEEIPITMHEHVKKEIKRLTGPEKKFFIQSMERAGRFRPFILEELKKAGLPEELSWLPLIESGFKLRALSSARALGLWQFIPSTGHKFGLTRDYYIDERMDPEKSTRAAIAYFKELHNLFGDWTTVLAAYNCGEYRVLKTIRRQKINYLDNFWDLYQNLPRETARYVPRFLATIHIVNNLEKYNMEIKNPQSPIDYESFEIKKQVQLKDIAREINVKTELLKKLNPELRHALLPPKSYQLKIPREKASVFLSKLETIKTTYSSPPLFVYHRVRKGDTLSGISKKYRTSVQAISRANNIHKTHKIIIGKVLKIPSKQSQNKIYKAENKIKVQTNPGKPVQYKVKPGDNLWIIAKRFSTTTKRIMAANKLTSTRLHIGQILFTNTDNLLASKQETSFYRVKSGDSPFLIAIQHNMSLNRFLALNHLNKRSKIFPGQKLLIE
jgi:membrane-bound lytic murein transglycosylase D